MTRDEILAMKPGPGLSALVGEHVINECRHDFERCGPNFWNYQCRKCGMEDSNFVKKLHVVGENKPYSTDIAAAWEVAEQLQKQGYVVCIELLPYEETSVGVYEADPANQIAYAKAQTPAEAICKAALLAVMEG